MFHVAGAVLSLEGLTPGQDQGVAPGRLSSSSNSPGGQACLGGAHLSNNRMFTCRAYLQSLVLEQVLDAGLCIPALILPSPQ